MDCAIGNLSLGIGLHWTKLSHRPRALLLLSDYRIACAGTPEPWDSIPGDFDGQPNSWDDTGNTCIWGQRVTADGRVRVPASYA